jgi:hypothetical protein
MKTMTISIQDSVILELLKLALQGGLILKDPDGREFVLAEIDDFAYEIELTRTNKKLMELLDERAKQTQTIKFEDAIAQLGLEPC